MHVRGDVFRRFVVGGRVEPEPEMTEEAWAQLRLRYRLAVTTADAYAEAGFAVVLQDVILGPVLAEVVAMIKTRPRYVVVLDPDPAVIAERAAQRSKGGYSASGWDARQLVIRAPRDDATGSVSGWTPPIRHRWRRRTRFSVAWTRPSSMTAELVQGRCEDGFGPVADALAANLAQGADIGASVGRLSRRASGGGHLGRLGRSRSSRPLGSSGR